MVAVRDFPMEKFLELLQDYCIHLCLTCRYENSSGLDGNSASLQERHHLLVRPQDRYDGSWERDLGCLYYSHSVVSAILSAKQLVTGSGLKGGGGTPHMTKPPSLVTLSKEDNSGGWSLKWSGGCGDVLHVGIVICTYTSKYCLPSNHFTTCRGMD